ncbi:ABC transporter permease [Candidatus Berkelbacteria bacterium]|nr:ABC transporter permease [Candidatus Berkelbacteria bacterium]
MPLELVWELAKTDFKIRYNGSILGYFWALLKPLLIFLILNFVFSNIFGRNVPHYSISLLTGIIVWNYFSEGTMVGMTSLLSKANLITKVPISTITIVLASTINATITFLINLVILTLFFTLYKVTPSFAALGLALIFFLLIYFLIIGFSLLTAPLFLKYRDLNQIWEVLLQLGFYASPIIYPLGIIPASLQKYLWLNPMAYLIHYLKLALINNQFITPSRFFILLAIIMAVLVIGFVLFRKLSPKIAENI